MVVKGKAPTLALASVREFRVVDLPLEGLPTNPMTTMMGFELNECKGRGT